MKNFNHPVSSERAALIEVDEDDNILGYKNHAECHDRDGILHRAFSIFIFNAGNQLLLQKRSKHKRLWPLYWSNSCCSHPRKGEASQIAAQRRLKEELGISTPLRFAFKTRYQAAYEDKGSEFELCSVYVGQSNKPVIANVIEIAEWKYMEVAGFEKAMADHPAQFTPWIKIEWEYLRSKYLMLLE